MPEIRISVSSEAVDDPIELERLHALLFAEVEDLDVGQVGPVHAHESEPGSRGVGAMLLGVVKVLLPEPAGTVLEPLINTLADYSKRTGHKTRIEVQGVLLLEIPDATTEQTDRMLEIAEAAARRNGLEL